MHFLLHYAFNRPLTGRPRRSRRALSFSVRILLLIGLMAERLAVIIQLLVQDIFEHPKSSKLRALNGLERNTNPPIWLHQLPGVLIDDPDTGGKTLMPYLRE